MFLALTTAWGWGLVSGYDAGAHQVRLPVLGATLTLGEGEHEGRHDGSHRSDADLDDDD